MPNKIVFKEDKSSFERFLRLIGSLFDPRSYIHGLKLLNYFRYTHVAELALVNKGKGLRISPTASFANGKNIDLGDHARIGANVSLWAGPGSGKIVIGPHCMIAPNTMLTASNYQFDEGTPINAQPMDEGDIIIGQDVWIGANSVILPGVKVGDFAIIGAGAVVREDVPTRCIVVGNPACVIGRRSNCTAENDEGDLALSADSAPSVRDWLTLAACLDDRRLEMPIEDCGMDSFELITLRARIEQEFETSIRDADWSGLTCLGDIARISSLSEPSNVRPPVQQSKAAATGASADLDRFSREAQRSTESVGSAVRDLALNMPQMALAGLSEAWLFKELGDLHWSMITRFLGTDSGSISDEAGSRLYATFTRISLDVDNGLRAFKENDDLSLRSHLERFGASFFFGSHKASSPRASLQARTMSTFAKYGERGKNTSLMKGTPPISDGSSLPSLEEFPLFGAEYRERRSQSASGEPIYECEYEQLGPHDINGVGLLYFAAYPIIFDICLGKFEGKDFHLKHTTISKDVCYFANAEPNETLIFRLYERKQEGKLLSYAATLSRKSDDVRMAAISAKKRFVGLHVPA